MLHINVSSLEILDADCFCQKR